MGDLLFNYTKRQMLLFSVFLLLYETSTYIANDMIMPGMISVVRSFNAPDSMVPASLTAYIFGGGSLQLFLGPLSDRFGRRPVMITGAILFLIFTLVIAFSQSIHEFIIARFFQGMGLCFIGVIGYATLQEIFTEKYAVRVIALMANITILAPLTGPLIGSIVIHYYSWRMVFHIIAVFAFISVLGLWLYMPETVGMERRDGTLQQVTPLRYSVIRMNYLSLLRNQRFIFGSLAAAFTAIPFIAWIGTSPLILIKAAHLSVLEYGLWQIPIFVFSIIGNLAMRQLTYRYSLDFLIEKGSWLVVASLIFTAILTLIFNNYVSIVIGITIYAFCAGLVGAPLNRVTLFSTHIPKGTASAMLSIVTMFTMGIANQLAGMVFAHQNNADFGLFCGATGLIYYLFIKLMQRAPRVIG